MIFPFCTIAYRFEKKPLIKIIFELSELGYKHVEIWAPQLLKESTQQVKSALSDADMRVSMISPYFNFTGGVRWWKKSLCLARDLLNISSELECPYLRCFTGNTGSSLARKQDWNDAVSGIQILADMACAYNIKIAIETHGNTLADTTESTLKLLDHINKSNVGLIFDPYNMWEIVEDDIYQAPNTLAPHIYGIHLKNAFVDTPRESPFPYVHKETADISPITYIKKGNVTYTPFFDFFFNSSQTKFMAIEWFGTNVKEAAKHELSYMNAIKGNYCD